MQKIVLDTVGAAVVPGTTHTSSRMRACLRTRVGFSRDLIDQ